MDENEEWPKWSPFAKIYDPLQSGSIDGTDSVPHDRALIRAMIAKYVPPHSSVATPNPAKTLFVGRLDLNTTEDTIRRELSQYGTVAHCRLIRDVVTGMSRGYAFVQFKRREDAERACRDAHHSFIDGREILVDWENARIMPGWIPRRLGGGFGGKKESGQLRFGGRDRPFRKPIVIQPMKKEIQAETEDKVDKFNSPDKDWLPKENWKRNEKWSSQKFPRDEKNKLFERIYSRSDSQSRDVGSKRKISDHSSRDRSGSNDYKNTAEWRTERRRGNYGKSSRDDSYERRSDSGKRYSRKSSKDYEETDDWVDSEKRESHRSRKYSSKSSKLRRDTDDRGDSEERSSDKRRKYSGKSYWDSREIEDWDDSGEQRSDRSKKYSSKSSKDRRETGDWEDNEEQQSDRSKKHCSLKDRGGTDDWEDNEEQRSDRSKKYSSKSSKDRREKDDVGDREELSSNSTSSRKYPRKSSKDRRRTDDTTHSEERRSDQSTKHKSRHSIDDEYNSDDKNFDDKGIDYEGTYYERKSKKSKCSRK